MSENSRSHFNDLREDADAGGRAGDHVDNFPRREIPPPWTPPARSTASRKVTGRGKGSSRGGFYCRRFDREITYESGLERRTALILAADPDVVSLADQPEPVSFRDQDGRRRRHTFDFLVERSDGSEVYAFVKPRARLHENRRAYLGDVAAQVDPAVAVVTEREASHAAARDASWLLWADGDDPEADAAIDREIDRLVGAVSIRTLAGRAALGPRGLRAAFRAVGDGRIARADAGAALKPECLVRRPHSDFARGEAA